MRQDAFRIHLLLAVAPQPRRHALGAAQRADQRSRFNRDEREHDTPGERDERDGRASGGEEELSNQHDRRRHREGGEARPTHAQHERDGRRGHDGAYDRRQFAHGLVPQQRLRGRGMHRHARVRQQARDGREHTIAQAECGGAEEDQLPPQP